MPRRPGLAAGAVGATTRCARITNSSGAIDRGQLAAASSRSAALIVTCARRSASTNVDGDTAGPDTGPLPNVGGAPGVAGGAVTAAVCGSLRHAMAAATAPSGAVIRNRLRVFMAAPVRIICRACGSPRDGAQRSFHQTMRAMAAGIANTTRNIGASSAIE